MQTPFTPDRQDEISPAAIQAADRPKLSREDKVEGADKKPQSPIDAVEEASMESFPASDPPSYTATHA